jgi:hypothetical protein
MHGSQSFPMPANAQFIKRCSKIEFQNPTLTAKDFQAV